MAAPGVAVPGSVVAIGSQASPAGTQGIGGTNAVTTTSAGFTVPAVGSTVSVTVVDASWVVVGQMVYVDQAGGGVGLSGVLQVTAKAGNTLTLLNPQPAPAIPPADATQAGLLKQLSGNTTDFVDGTNACQNLVTAVTPQIWSVRTRSFSSIGNRNFEVDQRLCGNPYNVLPNIGGMIDRWVVFCSGTMRVSMQQMSSNITIPGTNFFITSKFLRITLTTAQASLGATDYLASNQSIEGPALRELLGDVHSISVLVRSSVANLKFNISLNDGPSTPTRTLGKLCTLGAANTWTLITLPNLPLWDAGGTFPVTPGLIGYYLNFGLAAGSGNLVAVNDTWQNATASGFWLGPGGDNFASKTVGSTFDIAFCQHEPGNQCSTLMDVPFSGSNGNLQACQRYFQKSYRYPVAVGSADTNGAVLAPPTAVTNFGAIYQGARFPVIMAQMPTVTVYSTTGAINTVRDNSNSANRTTTGVLYISDSGFGGISISGQATTGTPAYEFHYTADTGW